MKREAAEGFVALLAHEKIVRHARAPAHAGGETVLGNVGETDLADLTRRFSGDVLPADLHRAALDAAHTGDGLQKLALAVALDGGDAEHLARADGQAQTVHGDQPAVVADGEAGDSDLLRARFAGLFQPVVEHRAADHHRGELFSSTSQVFSTPMSLPLRITPTRSLIAMTS